MQYLKDDVRDKIIASAREEFKTKGYLGASVRAIAAASETTPGNIYRYFASKEALFSEVVSPANAMMRDLVHADAYTDDAAGARRLDIDAVMDRIMSVFEAHSTGLTILLFSADGSKYQGAKADLVRLIETRLLEVLADQPDFAAVIASSFVEGLFAAIMRCEGDLPKLRSLIARLITLFFN